MVFLSNYLVFKIVLAALGRVDYPVAGDLELKYDNANKVYLSGGSLKYVDDVTLWSTIGEETSSYDIQFNSLNLDASNEQILFADDAEGGDEFGNSCDVYGEYAVVGASKEHANGVSDAGSVYVYHRPGNTWIQQAKLTASDGEASDYLGGQKGNLAIYGDTVVVGAHAEDTGGSVAGSAYVFVRSGTTWSQQAILRASNAGASDQFGMAVAIYKDTIVIGAPTEDTTASDAGSLYVFTRSGTTWTQRAQLQASNAGADDRLGDSVSIDGDTIIAGAYQEDTTASDAGSAYIFTGSGATWTQQAQIQASDAAATDYFGYSVSISGNTVVVGSRYDDDGGSASGSAYVFVRSGTTWTQQAKLTASDAAASDDFGWNVDIDKDHIVVAAYGEDTGGSEAGAIYVFSRSGSTWTEIKKIQASNAGASDYLGYGGVGIHDGTIITSSPNEDTKASDAGAAYIYGSQRVTNYYITDAGKYSVDATIAGLNYKTNEVEVTSLNPGNAVYTNDLKETSEIDHGTSASTLKACSVSLDGTRVALGANNGRVKVYHLETGVWTLKKEYTKTNAFGAQVCLNDAGTRLFVSDPNDNSGTGKVYVYDYSGGAWGSSETHSWTSPNGSTSDNFGGIAGKGISCNSDGTRLLVVNGYTGSKKGYIFDYTGSSWNASPTKSWSSGSSWWGTTCALNDAGDRAFIGYENGVDIFHYDGSNWPTSATKNYTGSNRFGGSLTINGAGTRLLVGSYEYSSSGGKTDLYDYVGGSWNTSSTQTINAPYGSSSLYGHGINMSRDGKRYLVAAHNSSTYFSAGGHVDMMEDTTGSGSFTLKQVFKPDQANENMGSYQFHEGMCLDQKGYTAVILSTGTDVSRIYSSNPIPTLDFDNYNKLSIGNAPTNTSSKLFLGSNVYDIGTLTSDLTIETPGLYRGLVFDTSSNVAYFNKTTVGAIGSTMAGFELGSTLYGTSQSGQVHGVSQGGFGNNTILNADGTRLLVTNPLDGSSSPGSASIYHWESGSWVLKQKWDSPDGNSNRFSDGACMNEDGTRLFLMHPASNKVYTYEYASGAWPTANAGTHTISPGSTMSHEASTLACNKVGDVIVIGYGNTNKVKIYRRASATSWSIDSGGDLTYKRGIAINGDGTRAFMGHSDGKIYMVEWNGSTWSSATEIISSGYTNWWPTTMMSDSAGETLVMRSGSTSSESGIYEQGSGDFNASSQPDTGAVSGSTQFNADTFYLIPSKSTSTKLHYEPWGTSGNQPTHAFTITKSGSNYVINVNDTGATGNPANVSAPGGSAASTATVSAGDTVTIYDADIGSGVNSGTFTMPTLYGPAWSRAQGIEGKTEIYGCSMPCISYDGTMVLTGEDRYNSQGLAQLWQKSGGSWSLTKQYLNPKASPSNDDYWGAGCGIARTTKDKFVIGMEGDDTAGTDYGSVWTYTNAIPDFISFDTYNKLSLSGITNPTSKIHALPTGAETTTTYDIGTATNIYIESAGTYSAEMKGSSAFALDSNIVSGTVSFPSRTSYRYLALGISRNNYENSLENMIIEFDDGTKYDNANQPASSAFTQNYAPSTGATTDVFSTSQNTNWNGNSLGWSDGTWYCPFHIDFGSGFTKKVKRVTIINRQNDYQYSLIVPRLYGASSVPSTPGLAANWNYVCHVESIQKGWASTLTSYDMEPKAYRYIGLAGYRTVYSMHVYEFSIELVDGTVYDSSNKPTVSSDLSVAGGSVANTIDGDFTNYANWNNASTHTSASQQYVYLKVDLGSAKKVKHVRVWNNYTGTYTNGTNSMNYYGSSTDTSSTDAEGSSDWNRLGPIEMLKSNDTTEKTINSSLYDSKLEFDGYNKLSLNKFDPTSSTLKYGSNTYDLGTISKVYISNPGTYSAEIKGATNFALSSNVVGTVSSVVQPILKFENLGTSLASNVSGVNLVSEGSNTAPSHDSTNNAIQTANPSSLLCDFSSVRTSTTSDLAVVFETYYDGASGLTAVVTLGEYPGSNPNTDFSIDQRSSMGGTIGGISIHSKAYVTDTSESGTYKVTANLDAGDYKDTWSKHALVHYEKDAWWYIYVNGEWKLHMSSSQTTTSEVQDWFSDGFPSKIRVFAYPGQYTTGSESTGTKVRNIEIYDNVSFIVSPSPKLDFDGYNKLTLSGLDSGSTSNVLFNGKTYSIGTASNVYIENTGTYEAESKGTTTFALTSKAATIASNPLENYRSATIPSAYLDYGSSSDRQVTICFWYKHTTDQPGNHADARGPVRLGTSTTASGAQCAFGVLGTFADGTNRMRGYTGTSSNSVYTYWDNLPSGFDETKWNFYIFTYESNGNNHRMYLPEFDYSDNGSGNYGQSWRYVVFNLPDDHGSSLTDFSVYEGNKANTESWRTTLYNNGQIGGAANETTDRLHYFRFHKDTIGDDIGSKNTDISSGSITPSVSLPGYSAAPSLTHDGYKLVVKNITPTSTTLKYGSNTYDIGTATNIYVENTGAYTAEIGGAADFAFTSNTVSGTIKTIEPGFASRYQGSTALTYDGKLYAWGMNDDGEAGVGTSSDITVPTLCTGITQGTVAKLLSGSDITDNSRGEVSAIKTTDGKIYMAGKGDNNCIPGKTSDQTSFTDVTSYFGDQSLTANTVTMMSFTDASGAALTETGNVWTWGTHDSTYKRLGQAGASTSSTPKQINFSSATGTITKITCGHYHTVALDSSGDVWFWGKNEINSTSWPSSITDEPQKVVDGKNIIGLASSYGNMYAWDATGKMWNAGNNYEGQIGDGTTTASSTGKTLTEVTYFSSKGITINKVYGGGYFTFADTSDGYYCWGNGGHGVFGNGSTGNITSGPAKWTNVTNIKKFMASAQHTTAITEDGKYYAWGRDYHGGRGDSDSSSDISYPKYIDALPNILAPSFDFDGYDKVFVMDKGRIGKITKVNATWELGGPAGGGGTFLVYTGDYDTDVILSYTDIGSGWTQAVSFGGATNGRHFLGSDEHVYYDDGVGTIGYGENSHGQWVIGEWTYMVGDGSGNYIRVKINSLYNDDENYTKFTKNTVEYDAGKASIITVPDSGTYDAQIRGELNFTLKSATVPATKASGLYTWAFHHGNFDNAYGDGDILTARDNGRFYADTPAYTSASIGTITPINYLWPSIGDKVTCTVQSSSATPATTHDLEYIGDSGGYQVWNTPGHLIYYSSGSNQGNHHHIKWSHSTGWVSGAGSHNSTSVGTSGTTVSFTSTLAYIWSGSPDHNTSKVSTFTDPYQNMSTVPYSTSTSDTTYTFAPPSGGLTANVMMVAGGGGGGGRYHAGGGGAGGLVYTAGTSLANGATKTIVVGNGDSGGNAIQTGSSYENGFSGKNTTFTDLTSAVGGGGGGANYTVGNDGGSGGGGGASQTSGTDHAGGSGTANQGNDGGVGIYNGGMQRSGGGGGGAGGAGIAGVSGGVSGEGGIGKFFGTGSSDTNFGDEYGEGGWFAGGGGGGVHNSTGSPQGIPGRGGGGYGQNLDGYMGMGGSLHGMVHTGGGGGGSGNPDSDDHPGYNSNDDGGVKGHGGRGGSGIVLIQTNVAPPNGANTAVVQVGNPRRRSLQPAVDYMGSEVNRWYIIDGPSMPTYKMPTHWYTDPIGSSGNHPPHNQGSHSLQKRADGSTSNVWYQTSYTYTAEYGNKMAQSADAVFMPVEAQRYDVLLSIGNNDVHDIQLEMAADGTAKLYRNNGATLLQAGTINCFTVGKWHHIALTVDSEHNAVGYVNGHPVVSTTYTSHYDVGSRGGNMHFRTGVTATFRKFLVYEVSTYNFHMSPKQVLQRAAEVGFGPKLEYDGLNTLKILNTEPGSTVRLFTSNVADTSNVFIVADPAAGEYTVPEAGKYYAEIKGANTFTITKTLDVTGTFPLYAYPPRDGTHSSITTTQTANQWDTWTISGAANGNGQYQARSNNTNPSSTRTSYSAFKNDITPGAGEHGMGSITGTRHLDLQLPSAKTIRKYIIWLTDSAFYTGNATTTYTQYDPVGTMAYNGNERGVRRIKSWTIQGSNNDSDWTIIHTVTNKPPSNFGDLHTISSPGSYQYYRIAVTEHMGSSQLTVIGELIYYGD